MSDGTRTRRTGAREIILDAIRTAEPLSRWNWVLEDPSDAGAVDFLRNLAPMLRAVIDEVE